MALHPGECHSPAQTLSRTRWRHASSPTERQESRIGNIPAGSLHTMNRVIAIDWSGSKATAAAKTKIWLAEARGGRLVRLESGRDRGEVIAHLIRDASADPDVVIGLDFAFSFPRWFIEKLGATSIEELWSIVSEQGEEWLGGCPHPFWGRAGTRKPKLSEHFRVTEKHASEFTGANPKSVFQIGGAGTVGTGSIRGMPYLGNLREEGFSIWPFHEFRTPLVIEIYPRLLTGPVRKADRYARAAYLAERYPEIDEAFARKAASCEDAFDAAVSAVVMSCHLSEISAITASRDDPYTMEGRIWWPRETRETSDRSRYGTDERGKCPFCDMAGKSVLAESQYAVAIADGYPVSDGHTLVILKDHAATLFAQSPEVQADVWRLVAKVTDDLQSRLDPDGINVGINEGRAAGQTVEHAHVHVIPRFSGDVPDPRGGVRWVLPERAAYWSR